MVAWINLMVQWRGESLQITLDTNDGDDPNHGMRYLIGADLYALSEQELEDILPPAWPQRLRMLVSKDVQRFIARKQDDAKKAVRHRTNDMMPIVFAVIIMFAIFSMLDALNGKKK
ncbi:hypothetical protein GQ53DRAFT_742351 [Thozetella sp. PMI_491]|nr:hypothetical protein GQ53DRAFT_742351 [Thozetella sp. PMI_491]